MRRPRIVPSENVLARWTRKTRRGGQVQREREEAVRLYNEGKITSFELLDRVLDAGKREP